MGGKNTCKEEGFLAEDAEKKEDKCEKQNVPTILRVELGSKNIGNPCKTNRSPTTGGDCVQSLLREPKHI